MRDIIWNISKICAWDCILCCVGAFYVKQRFGNLIIKKDKKEKLLVTKRDASLDIFEDAEKKLRESNLELSIEMKMNILDNIDIDAAIDFSGGDPLLLKNNLSVIRKASQKFGKDNISITTTGVGLSQIDCKELTELVGEIEFTYDYSGTDGLFYRPIHYNSTNIKAINKFANCEIVKTAQIPLSNHNMSKRIINNIYTDLMRANVNKIVLLRLFPVGRGMIMNMKFPSNEEYIDAIGIFKDLEKINGKPKVILQSTLTGDRIYEDFSKLKNIISTSLNITNMGQVLISPWAYDAEGEPIPSFIFGDVKIQKLSDMIEQNYEKALNKILNDDSPIIN